MADQQLLIEINAKVNDAIKGIALVNDRLGKIPPAAGKANDAFKKLGNTTAQANTSLVNFGRVVQDAPFGIIGIANNIDPLLSSFQQLKKETGSSGAAFKALAGALVGPAGIAIAVSAVTSLLIAFGPQLKELVSGVTEAEKAQGELNQSLGEERAKLLSLESAFNQTNATREQKLEIIKQLRKDYPGYLQNLTDEQILQNGIADAINSATQAIENRLRAAAFELNASKAITEQLNARLEIDRLALEIEKEKNLLAQNSAKQAQAQGKAAELAASTSLGSALRITALQGQRQALLQRDLELQQDINEQLQIAGQLRLPDFISKTNDAAKAAKKLADEFALSGFTDKVTVIYSARVQLINQAVAALEKERQKLEQISALEVARQANNQGATAPTGLAASAKIPAAILEKIKANANLTAEQIKKIDEAVKDVNAGFSILAPAIDQAFNALANGENASEAVTQAIKQMIVQLAKAVIQAAILSAILNAIAPGGAAQSFSSIFSKLLGFRAAGGPVSGGGSYIVGERGPELFTPSRSGTIVPNNELGGGGGGQLVARVSGSDLLFVLTQAQRNNKSIFG